MTISYSDRFARLLLRWKGSLWKTIYKDLVIFLLIYYIINFVFRFCLSEPQQQKFERISTLFNDYTKQIPLTFLLGFYVGMVVKRWWEQFQYIAYPDSLLMAVSSYIRGRDEESRTIRRTIARYTIATCVLAWRTLSQRVLKRFPTEDHLLKAGLFTEEELRFYRSIDVHFDPHNKWFLPIVWIQSICVRCHEQKRLTHVNELHWLLLELDRFRHYFLQLFVYDWVSIPLVYTQVATIATYGYFALCLIARQYPTRLKVSDADSAQVDAYIPIFTILQFLFFVGWLKVGEDLMNPFGEDDEDFELNYLLDRHTEIAFLIVDTLHGQLPSTLPYIDIQAPLLHTKGSAKLPEHRPVCHVDEGEISESEMEPASESMLDLREDIIAMQHATFKEKLSRCCRRPVTDPGYEMQPQGANSDSGPSSRDNSDQPFVSRNPNHL